ncbi:uncharacterized protein SCHCODRAFT_02619770 [Schizophyllum commune H4-8]|uniref:Fungal-type protein kinase domain-containing protein n=1 Tax=Schizophyllum commune (strain H4-8 / FGSC 9210) TaxID=578458 RepID=D8Q1T7_SCHCM|nr:uncharacterized protein SCHCODRAFT_02619770 [Schizophyllum commune H4-8]KAI5895563.1 hypothetical protein SCHCODRAFT_02619770 [Schizophyllum commune H4-8]
MLCAALNDWDIALEPSMHRLNIPFFTPRPPAISNPFAAVDVLLAVFWPNSRAGRAQHLYRHDLKALIWVLVWVVCCYKDERRVEPLPEMCRKWIIGGVQRTPANTYRAIDDRISEDARRCRSSKQCLLKNGWPKGGGPTATFKDREGVLAGGFLYWLSKCATRRELAKGPGVWVMSREVDLGVEEGKPLELETAEVWREFCEAAREAVGWVNQDALGYVREYLPGP